MREFTATLHKIMSVVSNQLELLPASEGAVEEMTYVDEEERDDTKLSGDHLLIETSLEIPKPTWKYRPIEPIERTPAISLTAHISTTSSQPDLSTTVRHPSSLLRLPLSSLSEMLKESSVSFQISNVISGFFSLPSPESPMQRGSESRNRPKKPRST